MMAEPTPAPWRVVGPDWTTPDVFIEGGGFVIAEVRKDQGEEVRRANALVMSASQEMKEALEAFIEQFQNWEDCEALDMAYSAIAKAKGEEP